MNMINESEQKWLEEAQEAELFADPARETEQQIEAIDAMLGHAPGGCCGGHKGHTCCGKHHHNNGNAG